MEIIKSSIIVLLLSFILIYVILNKTKPETPVEEPTTMNMELVCVTPHGHQVYSYFKGSAKIYVLVRHSDGYPIGISVY